MRGVGEQVDTLPPTHDVEAIPEVYSDAEAQTVLHILRTEQQRLRPYDGDFNAPWLLSAFDDPLWHTTNRGRSERVEGRWRNTINVDWNVLLPNGARLTDPDYARLLASVKQLSFLARSGYLGPVPSPNAWRGDVGEWLSLARWIVLHEARYRPATHAFALLDQNGVNELLRRIAQGGWTQALQIPERLLSSWYADAYGGPCPPSLLENPYALPEEVCRTLSEWLAVHSFYCEIDFGVYRNRHRLDLSRVAQQVNTAESLLQFSAKLRLFCRQFEPEFSASPLLLSTEQRTELPGHTTPVRNELVQEPGTSAALKNARRMLKTLLSAYRHLPSVLPDPEGLSVQRSSSLAKSHTKPGGHHEFIPVNTGLLYLNEALHWVHCYGESIIDYYLATLSQLDVPTWRTLQPRARRYQIHRAFAAVDGTRFAVDGLKISGFYRRGRVVDFVAIRSQPSLTDALHALVGACIVCIGLLKPSREAELVHLPRECLSQGHDGHYLRFKLGKSNAGEAYQTREKPIPEITAQAIRLLQRLGTAVAAVVGTQYKFQQGLFCLPTTYADQLRVPRATMLNTYLDIFCDRVALPPDSLGRRWYVRVHEMRKWFLLLLFWAGRFDVLDAVRWIAGHVRADHTYAYIEENFPGEELPAIEAEYSIDRLRHLDQMRRTQDPAVASASDENPGLEALYERVCRQFNVASLVMVPEAEWMEYVATLRVANRFSLQPHSLYAEDGDRVVGLTVSFVLAEDRA